MSDKRVLVAVSARALFDFEKEAKLFKPEDAALYCAIQKQQLDVPAAPGAAFALMQKLLAFNVRGNHHVEVAILSRNDPVTGLRVFKSAQYHGLDISRAIFTCGAAPHKYLAPLGACLFLSADAADVRAATEAGYPAACVYPTAREVANSDANELRIAFDGDSVLFSDEAERIFRLMRLENFVDHETRNALVPLPAGPLKPFLDALHQLQQLRASGIRVRTALVTARSAPAHERAIRTLMDWGVNIDEAMFLGGRAKAPFLAQFAPDMFFDDHTGNCDAAAPFVATSHVPYGVNNATVVAH
jgi:5'-nucleotidase